MSVSYVKLKRKLCTVCYDGVHYEYAGEIDGECQSYAEHCPCDIEPLWSLIKERVTRQLKTIRR